MQLNKQELKDLKAIRDGAPEGIQFEQAQELGNV